MNNKKVLFEIGVITAIGILLAIAYNIFNPNGLPFIPKDKSELIVSDSLLFAFPEEEMSDTINIKTEVSVAETETIAQNDIAISTKADTLAKEIKQTEKPEKPAELTLGDNKTKDGEFRLVTFEQMRRIVEKPDNFIIIDARHPDDYNKGHIPNAINIFPQQDEAVFVGQLLQLSREKTIVIYCDGGTCDLSHEVAHPLVYSFGFTRVFLYESGWEEWSRKK